MRNVVSLKGYRSQRFCAASSATSRAKSLALSRPQRPLRPPRASFHRPLDDIGASTPSPSRSLQLWRKSFWPCSRCKTAAKRGSRSLTTLTATTTSSDSTHTSTTFRPSSSRPTHHADSGSRICPPNRGNSNERPYSLSRRTPTSRQPCGAALSSNNSASRMSAAPWRPRMARGPSKHRCQAIEQTHERGRLPRCSRAESTRCR